MTTACPPSPSIRAICSPYASMIRCRSMRARRQLLGVGATGDGTADGLGFGDGAGDELLGGGPVEAHPALGGVHRFGDGQTPRPQVAAEGQGRLPVDRRGGARRVVGQRVGDHVRRGERAPTAQRGGGSLEAGRLAERVAAERAVLRGERHRARHVDSCSSVKRRGRLRGRRAVDTRQDGVALDDLAGEDDVRWALAVQGRQQHAGAGSAHLVGGDPHGREGHRSVGRQGDVAEPGHRDVARGPAAPRRGWPASRRSPSGRWPRRRR